MVEGLLSLKEDNESNGLMQLLSFSLCDIYSIPFQNARRLGQIPLVSLFPLIFMLVADKNSSVAEHDGWLNGSWHWLLNWSSMEVEEEFPNEINELQVLLADTKPMQNQNDSVVWAYGNSSCFTAKSRYAKFMWGKSRRL